MRASNIIAYKCEPEKYAHMKANAETDEIPEKFLYNAAPFQLSHYTMAKCAFLLFLVTMLLLFSSTPQYAILTGGACVICAYFYVKWDNEFSEWAKKRVAMKKSKSQ
jgi:hypothetical protein